MSVFQDLLVLIDLENEPEETPEMYEHSAVAGPAMSPGTETAIPWEEAGSSRMDQIEDRG